MSWLSEALPNLQIREVRQVRILVGISGGLDSTYTAVRLMHEGHDVEGAVLVMHDFAEVESAQSAADSIGIKLHILDCRTAFECVKDNFVSEYISGRTPNPCVICNPGVKFRYLCDFATEHGFDKIATGHYARVCTVSSPIGTRYTLSRAHDTRKDQTYMLYRLPQEILSILVLPLADMTKSEVRAEALALGLDVAGKKDSQEICFIPDGDYASYIRDVHGAPAEGDFVDEDGRVLGRHKGIVNYTVGQRKGLGISLGERVFVSRIDPISNTVTLSSQGSSSDELYVDNIVYSGIAPPSEDRIVRCKVKLRYQAPLVDASAALFCDGSAHIRLDSPVRAVTPGQSVVAYDSDVLLFGGFIR